MTDMSLATWKNEFYQQPADDVSVADAVTHSLRKWRGLTPENLSRHDVKRATFGSIEDSAERLSINTETCALCVHFWQELDDEDDDFDDGGHTCDDCPLALARGGVACDDEREGEIRSPYQTWVDKGDSKPMIFWLVKAQSAAAVDPHDGVTHD